MTQVIQSNLVFRSLNYAGVEGTSGPFSQAELQFEIVHRQLSFFEIISLKFRSLDPEGWRVIHGAGADYPFTKTLDPSVEVWLDSQSDNPSRLGVADISSCQ